MAVYYGPAVTEAFECCGQMGIPLHSTLPGGRGVMCQGTVNGLPVEVTITQEGLTGDAMIKVIIICGAYRDDVNFWDDGLTKGTIHDAVVSAIQRLKTAVASESPEGEQIPYGSGAK